MIAFYSNRDGNTEIYVVNADGGGLRRLTDNRATDQCPAWSPDGDRLAFVSDRDGNKEIYLMTVRGDKDASGAELQRLTNDPAYDSHPAWSPDGTHMAFISERDGNREIYVLDVQAALQGTGGDNPRRLTDHPADDMRPAWSPDGKRIAFNSERDGNWEIYIVDVDGDNLQRLTDSPTWEIFPDWSPNGTQIAYRHSAARGWNGDIWIINVQDALQGVEGSGGLRLTNDPGNDENPSWSPDGTQIVFQSDRYAEARTAGTDAYNFELLVLDVNGALQGADGDHLRRLTDDPTGDYWPTWGP
jgi:Tol biopolymer transport system component